MINTSIFTYLPPLEQNPDRAFLGFLRTGQEAPITPESWIDIGSTVDKKVFALIRRKFNLCTCCLDCIGFAWNRTEVGVILKKLKPQVNSLAEMSLEHVDRITQTIKDSNQKELYERISNFALQTLQSKDIDSSTSNSLNQDELNEFAIKTLCEVSIQSGIDKERVLNQVQQAKKEGYISQKSFNSLQRMLFSHK